MSEHTPGPWVVKNSQSGYPYQIDAPNGRKGPGGITSITRWGAIGFPSSHEGQANARLIAAAPELLEVVKRVAAIADAEGQQGDLANQARAAIAKAEGNT